MEFTLAPKSPRTTVILVVALVGSIIFVFTSGGGKSRKHHAAGPVAAATQAAQALANLAVPGPDAAATPPPSTANADTTFGENPFLSVETTGEGGLRAGDTDGGEGEVPGADGPGRGGPGATLETARTLSLAGTIIDGERRLALIGNRYYAPGQVAGGWRVTFIGPREARLERQGETITLKVGS